jgi:amino acid transporter
VEAAGLIFVIAVGMRFWGSASLMETPVAADGGASAITSTLLLQGAVLTFFSFLGFEDMLNVSEEVKQPNKTMPIAVISAMIIVSLVYMAVSITAVSVVPWEELKDAPGPLREVVARAAPWFPAVGFTFITIFAVADTALINYIMGSRLLYGMARQCLLPSVLGKVHAKRKTPHIAILAILAVVIILQIIGKTVDDLAAATVLLLLFVFILVNGALIVLKLREGNHPGCFNAPIIVPALAILICGAMLVARVMDLGNMRAPLIAGGLIVFVLALYIFEGMVAGKDRKARIEAYWADEADTPPKTS